VNLCHVFSYASDIRKGIFVYRRAVLLSFMFMKPIIIGHYNMMMRIDEKETKNA
jgi:hypothetical protein